MNECKNCLRLEKKAIELILKGTEVLEELKRVTEHRDQLMKQYMDLQEEKIHWELKKGTN